MSIGMCVKIKTKESDMPWYTKDILIVEGFKKKFSQIVFIVDRNLLHVSLVGQQSNSIHPSYTFRDDECVRMERKLKLEKINESR